MSLIKNELTELMVNKGFSQAKVARAISVSGSTLSQYLSGKYPGNITALETEISAFIERCNERDRSHNITITFVMTPSAKKGLELIKLAHECKEINVLYGEAGLGKTMILKRYAEENKNTVILIEADPGYTAKVLLGELCRQLNLSVVGNLHDLIEACVGKLNGSDIVLIVDEAELLPFRALEVLRRIYDRSGVGVVLAGMPRLILNLKGKRGELVQLYSRVGFALNLGNSLPRSDVKAISSSVIDELDEETEDAFFTASKGNARRLSKLLRGAVRVCRINDMNINAAAVQQFAQMLIN
ncbi:AAA family ATPase [Limnobaculum xujianqingii]|uniref:AAA family ATPase n=1 Tax=Limnobaculum xujianqingii TaxID=2738837 RepID=UPI00112C5840|nr:AAA family ATPase [Limnobaculum xujianqingii]